MNKEEFESLLRFLSEERAYYKYGRAAMEFNLATGEEQFTDQAERFIRREMSFLELTFHGRGFKPKLSLLERIKNLL